jgi:hypothetical protein
MQWDRGFSMPRLIAAFRTEHPQVEIELHRGCSSPRWTIAPRARHPSISV